MSSLPSTGTSSDGVNGSVASTQVGSEAVSGQQQVASVQYINLDVKVLFNVKLENDIWVILC